MLVERAVQSVAAGGCIALLLYAALHDIIGRTIPNTVSIILAGLGLIRAMLSHTVLPSMITAGAVFAAAVLVWRSGLLGGGDVKLLGSTCLIVTPQETPMLLASTAIIGGALACLYVAAGYLLPGPVSTRPAGIFRRVVRVELWRVHRRGPLPYAVAIALGTMTQLVGH